VCSAGGAGAAPVRGRGGPAARLWQFEPSMVWRDRVIAAPLDLDRVLALDQVSGKVTASVPLAELKNPDTVVGVHGDRLYAVGSSVVCFDLSAGRGGWGGGRPGGGVVGQGELFGRAAVSSEGVFVPTTTALLRFPLDGGGPQAFRWNLAVAGNVVIAPGRGRANSSATACGDEGAESSEKTWPDQVV